MKIVRGVLPAQEGQRAHAGSALQILDRNRTEAVTGALQKRKMDRGM